MRSISIQTALVICVSLVLFESSSFANEDHSASIVGVWTVKSHLSGDDQKEFTGENEKAGATFKFRKDGTFRAGESNDYLHWSFAETTKEMETWDTILGAKAKGTVCHYDVEFSADGKTMTWKGKNAFGIKQKIVLEKK